MIAEFMKAGKYHEIHKIKDRYTVFVDKVITQRELTPDEIVRYLATAAHSESDK